MTAWPNSILTKGCDSDPAMKELKKSNEDKHKEICTKIREDGAYVEAGENDNLLVQKVRPIRARWASLAIPTSKKMPTRSAPVQIAGVAPTEETIADLSYPGARKLYIYVKGEHLQVKPSMRDFVAQYAKMWSKGGPLESAVWCPSAAAEAAAAATQALSSSRSIRAPEVAGAASDMSLGLALVAILVVAVAAGWFARAARRGLRDGGRLHSPAELSRALRRAVGGDPGAAVARRLGADADAAGRQCGARFA